MEGAPFEAVKYSALKIGESLLKNNSPFEQLLTLTYNHKVTVCETKNLQDYQAFIRR